MSLAGTGVEAFVRSPRPITLETITVGDLLRRCAQEMPEQTALIFVQDPTTRSRRTLTYRELLLAAESVAGELLQFHAPGDRVVLWSYNRPEWLIVQMGIALAGLVLVAVSPTATAAELAYFLQQSEAAGFIYNRRGRNQSCEETARAAIAGARQLRHVIAIEDWNHIGRLPLDRTLPHVKPEQPALMQYTSGTTGRPKGALMSHYSLVNTTKGAEAALELPRGSRWLSTVPMYNTAGATLCTLGAMWNRGVHVAMPAFDPALTLQTIEAERISWVPLVPTMALAVLDHPLRPAHDLSSLDMVLTGGSPVPPKLVRRIEQELGADCVMTFGQTELSSIFSLVKRNDTMAHRTSTIGIPTGGLEARIRDPNTDQTLRVGEIGEICARGHAVMMGYFNMPQQTAQAIDAAGWLHTGDLGTIDENGYLRITGRLKDMIIRGGSNIYPRELEDLLATLPGIAQAAVFGLPDEKYGEVVAAAIQLQRDVQMREDEVVSFLRGKVSTYKLPSRVFFVDTMPLSATGKIQKFALREQLQR